MIIVLCYHVRTTILNFHIEIININITFFNNVQIRIKKVYKILVKKYQIMEKQILKIPKDQPEIATQNLTKVHQHYFEINIFMILNKRNIPEIF